MYEPVSQLVAGYLGHGEVLTDDTSILGDSAGAVTAATRRGLGGQPKALLSPASSTHEDSSSSVVAEFHTQRKRHVPGPQPPAHCDLSREGDAAAGLSSVTAFSIGTASSAGDDSVAALLPKMKRMRLRPSLGQLRLQREASEVLNLVPEVRVCVQPEQLRAMVILGGAEGCHMSIHLELFFPPQYPHKPPKVAQVAPEEALPFWQYEARCILLERLTERGWSSAMGVADIVRDLVQRSSPAGAAACQSLRNEVAGIHCELGQGSTSRGCILATLPRCQGCPESVESPPPTPSDVEMA